MSLQWVIPCEITHSKNESLPIAFIRSKQSVHPMILNISLLWLLVPEKQNVQISSISKNRPTSIGHNLLVYLSLFLFLFKGLTSSSWARIEIWTIVYTSWLCQKKRDGPLNWRKRLILMIHIMKTTQYIGFIRWIIKIDLFHKIRHKKIKKDW